MAYQKIDGRQYPLALVATVSADDAIAAGGAIAVGALPGGARVIGTNVGVSAAFGTGVTVDVGVVSDPTKFVAAGDANTVGTIAGNADANASTVPEDVVVNIAGTLTAGTGSLTAIVTYVVDGRANEVGEA